MTNVTSLYGTALVKCNTCDKYMTPRDKGGTEHYCSYECAKKGQPEHVSMSIRPNTRDN